MPADRDARFEIYFARIMGHEGGYVFDPNDPGGETKFGISKHSYPGLNIKELTLEDAKRIWKRDFWCAVEAWDLPTKVAFQAFDFAANSGHRTAIRYLQRALGVADDGWWGPVTSEAARRADANDLLVRFIAERLDFLSRLSAWETFGRGWARRIAQNLRYAAEDN